MVTTMTVSHETKSRVQLLKGKLSEVSGEPVTQNDVVRYAVDRALEHDVEDIGEDSEV